jgi:YggT family protein
VIGYDVLRGVLYAFLVLLIARFVADWVFALARDYRARGILIPVLEIVYSVTDPPLKALRRVIPPLRIGSLALDLAFIVLWAGILILLSVIP